ncbi:MAG: CheB methylesterase domain-containing protein [Rhodobacteraceae bacterium]|nr:CheB methylesterase domain-containing protein [Paracoccaceae bacterium]
MAPGFSLLSSAMSLSDIFADVESLVPDIVMIDAGLACRAEFKVMHKLFGKQGPRWLFVSSDIGGAGVPSAHSIDGNVSPTAIREQLNQFLPTQPNSQKWQSIQNSTQPLILIGASTGGVEALSKVLGRFPANCPPTIVVQHTSSGFGTNLVELLDRSSLAKVQLAQNGQMLSCGQITIAAGLNLHTEITPKGPLRIKLTASSSETHVPSIDRLFMSAVPRARRTVAAILTGMGRDGAAGMLELRRAGAQTFAQDSATSVVDGMPRAARELGAVSRNIPLLQMSTALLQASATHTLGNEQNTYA